MDKASVLHNFIKQRGLKITKNRLMVLEYLKKNKKPMAVEDISKSLKLNIVTTYRILESFVSTGLIYQTDFRKGKSFFEFQDANHHHHHITCIKCDLREHIDFCFSAKIERDILKSTSFEKVTGHIIEFFGICSKCNK
jgi:Fur family transcriptional regulator, ferric uptake regulator